MLVFASQPIFVFVCRRSLETLLMSSSLLPSRTQHVLLVLLGWFVRWEVSGRTGAVLKHVTSRIYLKQHTESLCSSHLAFSVGVLLKWCNYTVVLIQLQLGWILKIRFPKSIEWNKMKYKIFLKKCKIFFLLLNVQM